LDLELEDATSDVRVHAAARRLSHGQGRAIPAEFGAIAVVAVARKRLARVAPNIEPFDTTCPAFTRKALSGTQTASAWSR
jgi:hypothetical protein